MRGWIFTLFEVDPSTYASLELEGRLDKARLASWESGLDSKHWLTALIDSGAAVVLSTDGYPSLYTFQAKYLQHAEFWEIVCPPSSRPLVIAHETESVGSTRALHGYMRHMRLWLEKLQECPPEAALTLEVWDLS